MNLVSCPFKRPLFSNHQQSYRADVLCSYGLLKPKERQWGSSSQRNVSLQAKNDKLEPDLLALECPVPKDQQPVHELRQLQEAFLFDWAMLPLPEFLKRLSAVFLGFFITLGLPVSAVTFSVQNETLQCLLAASIGSSFVVTVLVLRLYLGWAHVGDRLRSATVEYEETGWYDGQVWVKPPQLLMRDRLLGNYTVKPALDRLKKTLIGLGGALAAATIILAASPPPKVLSADSSYDGRSAPPSPAADYWKSVEIYEPWALEDGDGQAPPTAGLMQHMTSQ